MEFYTKAFGINRIPYLEKLVKAKIRIFLVANKLFIGKHIDAFLVWGNRPKAISVKRYALSREVPVVSLEDGFLRSVGLGVKGYPPQSLVYDDLGIYYDYSKPSRLEKMLQDGVASEDLIKGQDALNRIKAYRLSKYNHHLFSHSSHLPLSYVLVVDQTFGDMSVIYGGAGEANFRAMLKQALEEYPHSPVVVKMHPDVIAGGKSSYLSRILPEFKDYPNMIVFNEDIEPATLIQRATAIYCVTSQMGFEGIFWQKSVHTFGLPWYATWGLTRDHHLGAKKLSERRPPRTLLELFTVAYLSYCRYLNPVNGELGDIFGVIESLALGKKANQFFAGVIYAPHYSLWKRAILRKFLNLPACHLHFISRLTCINKPDPTARILLWGVGKEKDLHYAKQHQLKILRMEDGFIRSVGLGSNLCFPLSLVVDDVGIYFDSRSPSRLENLLQNKVFSEEARQEAEKIKEKLIQYQITKYNVGINTEKVFPTTTKTKILVVGQVEDDASILFGSPVIKTNLDLLKKVRQANPDAWICYKPHPDVESKNRQGFVNPRSVMVYADAIAEDCDILHLMEEMDELHTMTSLSGFEALLRGKKVHTYGMPFYAGWGLTVDWLTCPRRTKKRTLNELIYATLVDYPLYLSPYTGQFIRALDAIEILQKEKENVRPAIKSSFLSKQKNKLQQLLFIKG